LLQCPSFFFQLCYCIDLESSGLFAVMNLIFLFHCEYCLFSTLFFYINSRNSFVKFTQIMWVFVPDICVNLCHTGSVLSFMFLYCFYTIPVSIYTKTYYVGKYNFLSQFLAILATSVMHLLLFCSFFIQIIDR
jgi:hypothetical protein